MKSQIISETAFTHEGDLDYLIKQIELAKETGSDYIKFQILLDIDSVYSKSTSLYHDMKSKMLSSKNWEHAMKHAKDIGLNILILPIDYQALQFVLESKYTDAIEIHSICLNDIVFLDKINASKTKLLIFLGVGGRTNKDIDFCINYLNSDNLVLMSGFQSFPTKKKDANLGKIKSLKNHYNYHVGYADHTPWDEDDSSMILTSLALGSIYIEKHIILKKGSGRADNYSAVSKNEFIALRNILDSYTLIYGNDKLEILSEKELAYKNRERKIVALIDIKQDTPFNTSNIGYSVTNQTSDILQNQFNEILLKSANIDVRKGEIITSKSIQ